MINKIMENYSLKDKYSRDQMGYRFPHLRTEIDNMEKSDCYSKEHLSPTLFGMEIKKIGKTSFRKKYFNDLRDG